MIKRNESGDPISNVEKVSEIKKILKTTSSMIAIMNNHAEYEFVNPSHKQILGYTQKELMNKSAFEIIHPDDVDELLKLLKKGLKNEIDRVEATYRALDKDKKIHYIKGSFDSIYNENGELEKIIAVTNDFTKEKRMQDALEESERKYRDLFNKAPIGIFRTDSEGHALEVNPQMAKMVGARSPQEAIRNFQDLSKDLYYDPKRREEFIKQIRKKGSVEDFVYRAVGMNGNLRWFKMNARISRKFPDGSFIIDGYTSDITEQKKATEALLEKERLSAIGEVASGVAHDFNNALQGILGNIELALFENNLTPNLKKYLTTIKNSALDAASRIKQLQRISGKRKKQANYQLLNVNDILEETILETRHLWKNYPEKKGHKIEIEKDLGDKVTVKGNSGELRSVFYNILKNSIQAMPNGGEICLKTRYSINDQQVRTIIKDTGKGMDEQTKKKLFQPFYTTKRFDLGKGLGLSAAYSIIKQHQGEINIIESEVGQGTTLQISLPYHKELSESNYKETQCMHKRAKILWVDDEKRVRDVIKKTLSYLNQDFIVAESGSKALDILKNESFDVLITDLGMPEMNGWQLSKIVKEKYSNLPIIVVTGWDAEISWDEIKKYDISKVIGKPIKIGQIKDIIGKFGKQKVENKKYL